MNKILQANLWRVNVACLVVAISVFLTACSWHSPAVVKATSDVTAVRRSASPDEPWEQELINELMWKTAVVVSVSDEMSIESIEPNGIWVRDSDSVGAAIPISRDGYLVTAAHTVRDEESLFIVGAIGSRLSYAPARVVWAPANGETPDFAILHTKLYPFVPFEIADLPSAGDAIASSGASIWSRIGKGWGSLSDLQDNFGGIGYGQVLEVSAPIEQSLPVYRLVAHTAPLAHGDSGGPLVDKDGKLIGINVAITMNTPDWFEVFSVIRPLLLYLTEGSNLQGRAIRPDFDWIMTAIEKDRPQHSVER